MFCGLYPVIACQSSLGFRVQCLVRCVVLNKILAFIRELQN